MSNAVTVNKKKEKQQRHHLKPKSRGGGNSARNIILLWNDKHDAWHTLFGTLTLREIIELLVKLHNWKSNKQVEYELRQLHRKDSRHSPFCEFVQRLPF